MDRTGNKQDNLCKNALQIIDLWSESSIQFLVLMDVDLTF